eukprot:CAMPEP_0198282808 /NCGR_PEP_ID=MMETSP1449-20131203/2558_1 /TAXON_ID=420275 /ORGANISM="Attheya septentrionalis, Strain CCMP2084" /LENGTH=126 /DNA_ID=CAMNT_0043979213 /DNA_START=192 /DNA_END=572 /DNA_ORIENTATION=-
MVDSGAKTMLKTDIVFLEREIKSRKQRFGVEVYELMELLEVDNDMSMEEKEGKIRVAFDRARKDIAVVHAKIECKRDEMTVLEEKEQAAVNNAAPQVIGGGKNHILTTGHPDDMGDMTEMEHGFTN